MQYQHEATTVRDSSAVARSRTPPNMTDVFRKKHAIFVISVDCGPQMMVI